MVFAYVVWPLIVKLPVTTKSPVIVPPAFALIELLALVKAAAILLFCVTSVAADKVAAELAAKKAASAVFCALVILVF